MNEQAANTLYDAERRGVRQIKGVNSDGAGGLCAWGVLYQAQQLSSINGVMADGCPLCGARAAKSHGNFYAIAHEANLIAHLNDDHGMTFSEIARKLGPDAA